MKFSLVKWLNCRKEKGNKTIFTEKISQIDKFYVKKFCSRFILSRSQQKLGDAALAFG